ncbi:PhzF family phenazine biosynthesis protein [Jannaschia sp. S6380]|uniref:PhzF family phenazine biosynthesis protein n=1 Tax=Jannaschia sp. S6380 TaxID=2926408 RepID=UPI001FF683F5|nr:PhzF family phenazine biosynthesis protein [Jannaschia sp. S6380]MCK0167067.1 PhzF family phenazine biosynthesis protein [Jannaschia sp. S6380]
MTDPIRIAAFTDGPRGGNPAGVVIADTLPDRATMQNIARAVGYSESAFAMPDGDGWRVRYFAPDGEVAFCGHATIALGSVLGQRCGAGRFALSLRDDAISVEAAQDDDIWSATLTSPATRSAPLAAELRSKVLNLFDLAEGDLDPRLPETRAHAGVDHAVLLLRDRDRLARMDYDFDAGTALMRDAGLTTISLLHARDGNSFDARNAFAIGGVVEDPATGAAAAALGGMLVDLDWPGLADGGELLIRQGDDMGAPSRIRVRVTGQPGAPVLVSGTTRVIAD